MEGRYGRGYGPREHKKHLEDTFGIGNNKQAEYVPEYGIYVCLQIHDMQEYDCVRRFAEKHDYAPPVLTFREKQGALKEDTADEWKEVMMRNAAKQSHLDNLLRQLEDATDFDFEYEGRPVCNNLEDTHRFYVWTKKAVFPFAYTITDRDKQKTKEIWFDSGLKQYCCPDC